jgi:hypothetical protein
MHVLEYSEFLNNEDFEEKVRYWAERSDIMQGINVMSGLEYNKYSTTCLEVLAEYYNKLPILFTSYENSNNIHNLMQISEILDYTKLLFLPLNTTSDNQILTGLSFDTLSLNYRSHEETDMSNELLSLYTLPRGNILGMRTHLGDYDCDLGYSGDLNLTSYIVERGEETEYQGFPQIYDIIPDQNSYSLSMLQIGNGAVKYLNSLLECETTFRVDKDEARECINMIKDLRDSYEDIQYY